MLIEFSVKNYRSIRDKQTFSMVASSAKEMFEDNTFNCGIDRLLPLLKTAVIYGPNAAGKSNFVKAMQFMRQYVKLSSKDTQQGELIKVTPFLFDKENSSVPSEFEVVFVQEQIRYQYGFAVTSQHVTAEWLIAYPQGSPQRWFERIYDPEIDEDRWHFSPKFKGKRELWKEATRKNALFLSTAIQLNNQQLKPVFDWFNGVLRIMPPSTQDNLNILYTFQQCETAEGKKNVLEFMNAADVTIDDIEVNTEPFTPDKLPANMPQKVKDGLLSFLESSDKEPQLTSCRMHHKTDPADESISLEFGEESDGTKKLFSLAGVWMQLLSKGLILVVDELDNSLHPLLLRFLVKLLQNPEVNKNNAQLIVATHNTTLLDSEILRRDQVWFMERDDSSASRLYPLSDFSPRKNEAIGKGYLQGRYGAVPFIGQWGF